MKKQLFCVTLFTIFINLSFAHPTKYAIDRNQTCLSPTPAAIKSWHIHVLFWKNNQQSVDGALKVREEFMKFFSKELGTPCTDLFHQDHLCMFDVENYPAGPFLTSQWSAFVPLENFSAVTTWALQNRNGYDVLIHPNSGCEVEDHSWWAFWSGNEWPLDLNIFGHDQPFPWPEDKIKENQKQAEKNSLLIKLFNKEHNQQQ